MFLSTLKNKSLLIKSVAVVVLPVVLCIGLPAQAQDDKKEERKYENVKTKKRHAVGKECAKVLEGVQEQTEAENWPRARGILEGAMAKCTTSYEKSQVYNFLGFVYYSLEDFGKAINTYKKMIREPEADERQVISTRYTVAQLYLVTEDYANAAKELEAWMKVSPIVSPDSKVLLGQAYYQIGRKSDSLRMINEAISEQEAKGLLPKEGWWGLQKVIYYERNDYKRVTSILKTLIKHYPSFSYWNQLGGMYAELDQEMNQLVTTEVAYLAGNLSKERQLLSLAYLYLGADAPYMAAKIIDRGMNEGKIERTGKNLEVLGLAWQQAEDAKKALPVLEQAAKVSGKGSLYSRLAGVYLDLDQNRKSVVAARNAVKQGGFKRIDMTYMTMGNALLNLHCYNDAIKAFRNAAKDDRSAKYAKQWIQYAEREGDRRSKLIKSGAKIAGCKKV